MRLACVGHRVYFENHFCEKSAKAFEVGWFDFDHLSTLFYDDLRSFRPDITLVYRPELHAAVDLNTLPGIKVGFSTEPLPKFKCGQIMASEETDRRLAILQTLAYDAFDVLYHYDEGSADFCKLNHLAFQKFHHIPVNIDYFKPSSTTNKIWDAVFVGKATGRRIDVMSGLKTSNRPFLWIEHGVSGRQLAWIFQHAKCVLNVHADALDALEPRVYLAAACGVPVLSDHLSTNFFPFSELVRTMNMHELSFDAIDETIEQVSDLHVLADSNYLKNNIRRISVENFILDILEEYI